MKKFSFDTIKNFDSHIHNSIKGYDLLDYLILNICSFFIKDNTLVIDLGCTTGRLLNKIYKAYKVDCIGYDITDNQFLSYPSESIEKIDFQPIEIKCKLIKQDITKDNFKILKSNLIISVFTLQFININKRLSLLKKVYNSLNINGAFILCEKEICNDGIIQEVFTFSNYTNKKKIFTAKEILDKEYDLRKIMNSLNAHQNIELLKKAGFKNIEPFFQSLNFKGYLCRK